MVDVHRTISLPPVVNGSSDVQLFTGSLLHNPSAGGQSLDRHVRLRPQSLVERLSMTTVHHTARRSVVKTQMPANSIFTVSCGCSTRVGISAIYCLRERLTERLAIVGQPERPHERTDSERQNQWSTARIRGFSPPNKCGFSLWGRHPKDPRTQPRPRGIRNCAAF